MSAKIGSTIFPKEEKPQENPFDAVNNEQDSVNLPRVEEKLDPPPSIAESEFSFPFSVEDLELTDISANKVPDPPKCVQEWCRARDLVWRWLSPAQIKFAGMRGYIAFTADAQMRKKIKASHMAAMHVDVNNYLCWREDTFLGITPRKLAEYRRRAIEQRTIDQTKRAKGLPSELAMVANRAGIKVKVNVNEREAPLRDAFKGED